MNKNNNKPVISILRPRKKNKNQKTIIEQQISPLSNGMRSSNRLLMSGDYDVGPHVNLTNIQGSQKSKREIILISC